MKAMDAGKLYVVGTQGIFSLVAFTGLGFFIGWQINKDSIWPAILAVIGGIIGLICFIMYLLYFIKILDKQKKEGDIDDKRNEN